MNKPHVKLALLCMHFLVVCLTIKFIFDAWQTHNVIQGMISGLAWAVNYYYFEQHMSLHYDVARLFCGGMSLAFLILAEMLFITPNSEHYWLAEMLAEVGIVFWALRAWGFHDMIEQKNKEEKQAVMTG